MSTVLDIPTLERHLANLRQKAQQLALQFTQVREHLQQTQGAVGYVEGQLRELKAAKCEDSPDRGAKDCGKED